MNPVLVTTHIVDGHTRHIAWSPTNYFHDMPNQHPMTSAVYRNFFLNVTYSITENGMNPVRYTYTDFHCNVPIAGRTNSVYFCIENNHVVSPVFFHVNEMHDYVQNHPLHHTIYVAEHRFI